MPTPAELAAQLRVIADQVAALVGGGGEDPDPAPQAPGKPTGLTVTTLSDGRLQLDWDDADWVTEWDVLDLNNPAQPLKETVTVSRSIRSAMKKGGTPRRYVVVARNAAGESPASDPVDVGGQTPDPGPDPDPQPGGKLPTDVLPALKTWTVTTTTGSPGSPTNLYPAKIGDGEGFIPEVFYVRPDGGVMFRATVNGVTTPNSKRCRVEARQMADDAWTKAAWSPRTPHSLEAEFWASTAGLTKRKRVSALQIHDGADDVLQVVADAELGLALLSDDGDTVNVLDPDYRDEQRCVVRIDTDAGKTQVAYNAGQPNAKTVEISTTGSGYYFKAGAYNQASMQEHGEPASAFSEVCIYTLMVTGNPLG
jgi:hypothetical protein